MGVTAENRVNYAKSKARSAGGGRQPVRAVGWEKTLKTISRSGQEEGLGSKGERIEVILSAKHCLRMKREEGTSSTRIAIKDL